MPEKLYKVCVVKSGYVIVSAPDEDTAMELAEKAARNNTQFIDWIDRDSNAIMALEYPPKRLR